MATTHDCMARREWSDIVDEEGDVHMQSICGEGLPQEHLREKDVQLRQEQERLEAELTQLALVTTESKLSLQDMLLRVQDTDDEIRLGLTLIRAALKRDRNEPMLRGELINWDIMGQRITATLAQLEECQDSLRKNLNYHLKAADLRKLFSTMTLTQRGQGKEKAARPPLQCFYCHEEGHIKRECPHRLNKEKWMQTTAFKQKTALRRQQEADEMAAGEQKAWRGVKEKECTRAMTIGQSLLENAKVRHNPLN